MEITEYAQFANDVDLIVDDEFLWRPVPNVWGYEAHPDGAVRRADEWKLSCILHPAEGVLVPVHFEGNTYGVPRRYMVASAHLAKPRQVFMRQGRALVWRYDVARKNGDVTDDRAVNLYWHELPEPVSYASLMREAKWARRPWGVSPATKPYGK
ncbi:hypothetical protein [Mycolicibacterium pallens]|uniref:Uncharacterized protein n=1 Tax=Mycolicibacterium pallens TaxID=370524 RepID=A0ABX8VHA1_9MYCO|nr:hypothetical protein [Mycolicibacterium pallens]QYL14929.1 hypothetical protein K0O64_17335 [Mycolicibacterium pallens]